MNKCFSSISVCAVFACLVIAQEPVNAAASEGSRAVAPSTASTAADADQLRAPGIQPEASAAKASPRASIATDKFDYQPGETALITGAGFEPGEVVVLQVRHANGIEDGDGHVPFNAVADGAGVVTDQWFVHPDDSLHAIFILSAEGATSGRKATNVFADALITVVDDQGPDDYPGQKDLSFLAFDYGLPGSTSVTVMWGWDDTAWSGGNTGDACTLIDTDADGKANYSLCITVGGTPAAYQSTRLYSCGDQRSDRCDQPTTLIANFQSTGTAGPTANSDPFRNTASHLAGTNKCGANPGCRTNDTVATAVLKLADFGGAAAKLINVCSYPSQEPNSAPSECVITPNNGFLTIVKSAGQTTQPFTFNLGTGQTSQDGTSSWTITGSGQVQFISFAASTDKDLTEAVPSGWKLDSASCFVQTAPPTATGTLAAATISNITIQSGLETICTFNDSLQNGTLKVKKVVVNDNGGTKGVTDFSFQVNAGAVTQFEADGQNDLSVIPGTYSVTEPAVTGYTTTYDNCTSVQVAAGGSATCTITNNDQAATLIVKKVVVNDNGGTKGVTDFSFQVNGGNATAFEADGQNDLTVNAGTYGVTEPAVTGYTTSYNNCSGIVLANGGTATCTITNNDQGATLIVIKHVINDNGGTKVASDFTMNVTGTNVQPAASFPGEESPGTTVTLSAGSFSVDENAVAGYTKSIGATGCSGTIALGETKTCTITNDDAKAGPGGSTLEGAVLHDSITIQGVRPGAPVDAQHPEATVTFRLYSDAGCSAQVGSSETRSISYNAAGTVGTSSTAIGVSVSASATTIYYWTAQYSGNGFNDGFTTACGDEKTTIVFQP